FTVESGTFKGDGLAATMTGRISDAGAVSGHATGSLNRPLHLPGATFSSLAFTADLSGQLPSPKADIKITDGAATIAGLPADNLAGAATLKLGDKVAGDFTLTGSSTGQALLAAGRIEGNGGDWRVLSLNGRLGGVQVTASQLSY